MVHVEHASLGLAVLVKQEFLDFLSRLKRLEMTDITYILYTLHKMPPHLKIERTTVVRS